ncbi:HupE/UreJ family protein [Sphingomonas alpina]|uniref:HupE/UreJ family protein n=1 Tax=Sphingomonas alpina TaxID=653931 RepID=A0A7H0LF61_9SPHN|nr:HupE/UreJ family protein [Sphingomonas alpina]QNQ08314.1 HupE/UreJ family protein [Sphingomonas alpina]
MAAAIAGMTVCTSPAMAHDGTGLAGGFASGFYHPFTGMDHLLAMVAVGLWGAFLGRPLIYLLPVIFPLMMIGGAVLGMAGVPVPPMEIGIALSVIGLGSCIALAWRAPVRVAVAVVALFALFHGYAHGVELPSAADPIGYSTGFVLATGSLHVAGIGLGFLTARPGGMVVTRLLGCGIGMAGICFLCMAIGR